MKRRAPVVAGPTRGSDWKYLMVQWVVEATRWVGWVISEVEMTREKPRVALRVQWWEVVTRRLGRVVLRVV